jgi:3'-phosphoadenosine 5'-phosphosulfate sulfotransferase (PAPS reductase)/FAD synthetase
MLDPDATSYDHYIVSFSGGKDSMACLLHLLELGVCRSNIELWHMLVDGRPTDPPPPANDRRSTLPSPRPLSLGEGQVSEGRGGEAFMDWPVTEAYCHEVAQHFGLPLRFAWKEGGFLREMLRDQQPTAPTHYELPDGTVATIGGRGPAGTRLKFPQVSADLSVRWCSAYLKVDVCSAAVNNQERFRGKRTVIVTGERGEESSNRAKYAVHEPDRTDRRHGKLKRHVDHWRPIRDWPEADVWAIMQRWKVRPHPAYQLGWSRVSCATCIFGNAQQWASAAQVLPGQVQAVAEREAESGLTIKRKVSVPELVATGTPYPDMDPELVAIARGTTYPLPIIMDPWHLPRGAFGDGCGPG